MRVLGIDYGEKRVGLAISDELLLLARELVILSPKEFWRQLPGLLEQYEVQVIALGWPLNMQGQLTDKTREVEAFQQKLERSCSARVVRVDERLSSQMASSLPGGHKDVDSLAAQIILQNYLNSHRPQN
jgi:putative Holliday junction resolvase